MLCVRVSRFPSLEDAAPKCPSLAPRPSPLPPQRVSKLECLWGGDGVSLLGKKESCSQSIDRIARVQQMEAALSCSS
jgi:hypothetical protein